MIKEFEIKYHNVDHDKIRNNIVELKFNCTSLLKKYKCKFFHFEKDKEENRDRWGRLKDDGESCLMSIKEKKKDKIGGVYEIDLKIDDFDKGEQFFLSLDMKEKGSQNMTREIWFLEKGNITITLDHWEGLEPSIEIESISKENLEKYSNLLGLDFSVASW